MLQKQILEVPLTRGIDTKSDPFLSEIGFSLVLENARFEKVGRLSKRFGLAPLSNNSTSGALLGGKFLVADDEQMQVVTSQGGFSYAPNLSTSWRKNSVFSTGIGVESEFVSKSGSPEIWSDGDVNEQMRATVSTRVSVVNGNYSPMITLEDISTGQRLDFNPNLTIVKTTCPRILVLKSGTAYRIFLFSPTSSGLFVSVYDQSFNLVGSNTISTDYTLVGFDVFRVGNTAYLASMRGDLISLYKFTYAGSVTPTLTTTYTVPSSTSLLVSSGVPGGLSLACNGSVVVIGYIENENSGTGYMTTFNDSFVNVLPRKQIATNGFCRKISLAIDTVSAYVSHSGSGDGATASCIFSIISHSNASAATVQKVFGRIITRARPFILGSQYFFPTMCPEESQMTGLLFSLNIFSDLICAQRFTPGFVYNESNQPEPLFQTPNSVNLSSSSAMSFYPALFNGDTQDEGDAPLTFTGSRSSTFNISLGYLTGTRSKVGSSIYLTAGITLEIDGRGLFENNFFLSPSAPTLQAITGTTNPDISSKTFSYFACYEYFDASGQIARSRPSLLATITTPSNTQRIQVGARCPVGSIRPLDQFEQTTIGIAIFRTTDTGSTPYRLYAFTNANNDGRSYFYDDTSSDAAISNNEILYTNGNVLENDPAPSARFSTAGNNRLYLGGLEEKDEIAYSKQQLFGESVAFSDFLRLRISSGTNADKSPISALGYMDGKIIIFRERSLYYVAGDGPNELGDQNTFTNPEIISSDVGCTEPRSVLNIPDGILFKSKKGIYLLGRGLDVTYIGSPVEDFNNDVVVSATTSDKYNEARFNLSSNKTLVYNHFFKTWGVFTGLATASTAIADSDSWRSDTVTLVNAPTLNALVLQESSAYLDNSSPYAQKIKTSWIKLTGIQNFGRIWSATILGKYRSAHDLIVNVRYDYDDSYVETYTLTPELTDSTYQYRVHLKKQKCESIQFEIYDANQVGQSMDLTALSLEVGVRKGTMKLPASRKY